MTQERIAISALEHVIADKASWKRVLSDLIS
jgi:hypothetical protein